MAKTQPPRTVVIGNEKGGAGKSTIALHLATALLHQGATVAVLDLDLRQQSLNHFFAHRKAWSAANDVVLPMPVSDPLEGHGMELAKASEAEVQSRLAPALEAALAAADYVIVDTPGADTAASRFIHAKADSIVTPLNDSFVDFDMLGLVDPVTLELTKPSLYAEAVWEARKLRMVNDRRSVDWLVLRNRLASTEARNRKRLDERIQALAKRVGFRVGPGLRDRVIYRELFPFGLTIADLSSKVRPVSVTMSHLAARQELRSILSSLGLGVEAKTEPEIDAA